MWCNVVLVPPRPGTNDGDRPPACLYSSASDLCRPGGSATVGRDRSAPFSFFTFEVFLMHILIHSNAQINRFNGQCIL